MSSGRRPSRDENVGATVRLTTKVDAERTPEGRRLLNIAGMLLLVVVGGRIAADLTGVGELDAVGLLAFPLIAYLGLLAGDFRGWARQVVATDQFRHAKPSVGARVLAWGYATTGRVRTGAGVLAFASVAWFVIAARVVV